MLLLLVAPSLGNAVTAFSPTLDSRRQGRLVAIVLVATLLVATLLEEMLLEAMLLEATLVVAMLLVATLLVATVLAPVLAPLRSFARTPGPLDPRRQRPPLLEPAMPPVRHRVLVADSRLRVRGLQRRPPDAHNRRSEFHRPFG